MTINTDVTRPRLSVVIIMHNEAHNIEDCLDSVSFADEFIVVDSGSNDASVEKAQGKGAKVIIQPWLGFGPQKNFALQQATGDWILSIDADERITPNLAFEILQSIKNQEFDGYEIPRLSQYCGKEIRHSGWWPDNVLRLFKADRAVFSDDLIHEKVICQGKIGLLNHYMQHISYRKIEEVLHKVNSYSTAGAKKVIDRKKKTSFSSAFTHGLWAFIRSYIVQRGFLDGKHGLMLAISNAEGTYYRYLKAWFESTSYSKSRPRTTLVITTYNRPDALRLVLTSVLAQTSPPYEVIIADDGSTEETAEVITHFKEFFKTKLKHVYHKDEGFRASAIRNKAIAASTGDYIVFTDGDCILKPDFIEKHQLLSEKGYFISGSRILLSERITKQFEQNKQYTPLGSFLKLLKLRLRKDVNRLLPLANLGVDKAWRVASPNKWEGAKTCNLSAWKSDIIKVNGFDESFEGWGMEDSDFVIRLQHAGIFHKNGRFASTVFHLWHKENDRSQLAENQAKLASLIDSGKIVAEKGLSQTMQDNN